jgi:hypothetical protein
LTLEMSNGQWLGIEPKARAEALNQYTTTTPQLHTLSERYSLKLGNFEFMCSGVKLSIWSLI